MTDRSIRNHDRQSDDGTPLARWLASQFELSRGGSAQNVRPMEGLRGFAVFLVFLVHYTALIEPLLAPDATVLPLAAALHAMGNVGVDLFFVLSGYLIYGSLLARSQSFAGFMRRRIVRIYPAFAAVFLLYVVLSLVFPSHSELPEHWPRALLYLVQNFLLLPGLWPIEPMITVAWSLSYEMFFYLVIPLLIAALGLRQRSPRHRAMLFVGIALSWALWCAVFGGPIRLNMFIAGMLLVEAQQASSDRLRAPSGSIAFVAVFAGLAVTLTPLQGPAADVARLMTLFAAFFVVCLSCFERPTSWFAAAMSWLPLRWLGNMSYSYYLLHGLALQAGFLLLSKTPLAAGWGNGHFWALLPPMFALSLVPAAALFVLIERPLSLTRAKA